MAGDGGLAIEARGVVRRFGPVEALRGLDITVPYGQVTALVGANGAGKTTLLLILATLLAPDAGTVRIAGHDALAQPVRAREALGWMPDTFGVYDQLTVDEYLAFFADAYGLSKQERPRRIRALLSLVHLEDRLGQPVHALSRGQKQRLGMARALVHRPRVLLLDEPASGLDPRSRIELRDLLRSLAADGVAVLVSSHILSELEEIADRVVLVDHGRTAGDHAMAEIAGAAARVRWRIRSLDLEPLAAALDREPGLAWKGAGDAAGGAEVGPLTEDEAAGLLARLVTAGVPVSGLAPAGSALESAYLAMTEDRR
ncbi:ABC transporter ATP-binding protein [Actinomadura luteofluorescens]|uniref:ABC-2 type transport system ATP-binding protein n=1 Tax=Actinomadura luteofluorescens TaxID=46163 RepID=A0A7Y9EK45_9ACTN|nr:ABC transporter ATP-binding protein [Actinomadura luteofluorescens]NYD49213.1 ABC-2 type transport system ATP-binding protein [Actinomadura luteofluorescens]